MEVVIEHLDVAVLFSTQGFGRVTSSLTCHWFCKLFGEKYRSMDKVCFLMKNHIGCDVTYEGWFGPSRTYP